MSDENNKHNCDKNCKKQGNWASDHCCNCGKYIEDDDIEAHWYSMKEVICGKCRNNIYQGDK